MVFAWEMNGLDEVVRIPVSKEQIEIAVIVVVEEFQAPPAHQAGRRCNSSDSRLVVEGFVVVVLVERIHFAINVGDEQVRPTVFVEICCIDSHSRSRAAFRTIGNSCLGSNFLEAASVAVHEEKVSDGVVGHKQIHTTVVIQVGSHRAPGFPEMTSNPRGLAHIREGAISVVVEQPARRGLVEMRYAVSMFAILAGSAILVFGFRELHELADKQIELPVVVVIKPNRARAPAGSSHACLFSNIGEGTVAVVVVENAAAVLRNVEVGKPVPVVVPHGYALPVASSGDARFFCDIGKASVTIVTVEGVAQGRRRIKEVTFAA